GAARCGFSAADGEACGFYTGELEKRRGRDYFRIRIGRRCEKEVSERLEVAEAIHPYHSPAEIRGQLDKLERSRSCTITPASFSFRARLAGSKRRRVFCL